MLTWRSLWVCESLVSVCLYLALCSSPYTCCLFIVFTVFKWRSYPAFAVCCCCYFIFTFFAFAFGPDKRTHLHLAPPLPLKLLFWPSLRLLTVSVTVVVAGYVCVYTVPAFYLHFAFLITALFFLFPKFAGLAFLFYFYYFPLNYVYLLLTLFLTKTHVIQAKFG